MENLIKMKIAVFGAGSAGRHLASEIKFKLEHIQIIGFIDNLLEGQVDGIKIYKPITFFNEELVDAVIVAAGAQKTLKIILECLLSNGIKNIYILHDVAGKNKLPLFEKQELVGRWVKKVVISQDKPILPYFEMPITDVCNLNCKGCLFICNSKFSEGGISLEQIHNDLKRMSQLFSDIPRIRILGGEPLLHPDVTQILRLCRSFFPNSEIDLCTNGIKIIHMQEEFFKCIIDAEISIHISAYEPVMLIMNQIDEKLSFYNIHYVILKRDEFLKYYSIYPNQENEYNYENCIAYGCRELYRGIISNCSAQIAFEKMNKQFGTNYQLQKGLDWVDIHDNELDGWKIVKMLEGYMPMCSYCDIKHAEKMKWKKEDGKVILEDYIIS